MPKVDRITEDIGVKASSDCFPPEQFTEAGESLFPGVTRSGLKDLLGRRGSNGLTTPSDILYVARGYGLHQDVPKCRGFDRTRDDASLTGIGGELR